MVEPRQCATSRRRLSETQSSRTDLFFPPDRTMKNFLRAARMAVRHRCTVAAIVVTALLVGVLWGINIGAVYPFVEVVFRGQSLHGWV